jgi:hypothetical protein
VVAAPVLAVRTFLRRVLSLGTHSNWFSIPNIVGSFVFDVFNCGGNLPPGFWPQAAKLGNHLRSALHFICWQGSPLPAFMGW